MGERSKKKTGFFIGGFIVLLAVFTFLDLPISKAVFNIDSTFGAVFAAFGEMPAMLVAIFSCAALIITRDKSKKASSVVQIIGFGFLAVMFALLAGYMPTMYINMPKFLIILGPAYAVLAFFFAAKVAKAEPQALRKAAMLGIILAMAAMVIINIIKIFWGRPRMRIMDDPDSQFTFWFMLQGIAESDQYKSFPSGHSANAACVIWLTLLPVFLPNLRTKSTYILLNCIAYAWVAVVMLSRIVMGAHFATDVLMGASITIFCFYQLKSIIFKNDASVRINS